MTSRMLPMSAPLAPQPSHGISLIEVLISLVLVSTVLLVSVTASANLLRNNTQRRAANQGQQLAAQFLDEISSMDFRDRVEPTYGLELNELSSDRSTFDDVDDYHGYTITPPTHRDGTVVEGFEGWSVSVSVAPADPDVTGITTTTSNENSLLRIVTVVCTAPEGTTSESTVLVSDVPADLSASESYETWRRIKLTFPDREINVTAPLRNSPATSPLGS